MKLTLRNLWIILAVLSLPTGGLQASESNATVLNSKELAEIKGGWCIFEICEGAPGTGICQPVPANQAALCALTTCKYSQEEAGNIEIFSCNFKGPYTCSNNRAYRQCILAFKLSACGFK